MPAMVEDKKPIFFLGGKNRCKKIVRTVPTIGAGLDHK